MSHCSLLCSKKRRLLRICFQVAELYKRGWNQYELAGLTGANLLRVFEGAEQVAHDLQAAGAPVAYDLYDRRTDIPDPHLEL